MRVIGLTGGIGSGKSAVSAAFARRGVPVIDTDLLARDLVRSGQDAFREIVRLFGDGYLTDTGELDRRALRQRIIADPDARRQLEAMLHPRILNAVRADITTLAAPYCLVVVPLLAENPRFLDLMDRVLVVDVPESVQLARVMARDRIDARQARAIIATQADRTARLSIADDIIDNRGDPGELEALVERLHTRYLASRHAD